MEPGGCSVDHPVRRIGAVEVVRDRFQAEAVVLVPDVAARVVVRSERCKAVMGESGDREEGRVGIEQWRSVVGCQHHPVVRVAQEVAGHVH